ncbi:hypothetical protein [Leifsonia shinshuensis]|uniref:hypothetical protein n=1 Tax=Leifsonia shinshuensis TaxID=150026 RepID=UPI002861FE17|nr:hypothetical protein [Leifsonia shinshuensis]MDR6972987.1 hypothetical protein [Leifsonia shinshuensis]
MSEETWRAAFVHPQHPWRDFQRTLPVCGEVPPAAIRRPGSLAGMPAFDVYLLSDSSPWPAASTYTYTQSVLGDLRDHRPPEFSIDLEDDAVVSGSAE